MHQKQRVENSKFSGGEGGMPPDPPRGCAVVQSPCFPTFCHSPICTSCYSFLLFAIILPFLPNLKHIQFTEYRINNDRKILCNVCNVLGYNVTGRLIISVVLPNTHFCKTYCFLHGWFGFVTYEVNPPHFSIDGSKTE